MNEFLFFWGGGVGKQNKIWGRELQKNMGRGSAKFSIPPPEISNEVHVAITIAMLFLQLQRFYYPYTLDGGEIFQKFHDNAGQPYLSVVYR